MSRVANLGKWLFGTEGDVVADSRTQVMVLAALMLVTGVVVVSPLVSDLAGVFGVSESRAGLLMIVLAAPQPFFVPVMGIIADRTSRKRIFVLGLLLFGAAGGMISLTTSFDLALILRFLQGVGFSAAMPMTIVYFGDLYEDSRETTAQSFRMVGINSIYIISPFFAGVMFVRSWRFPFLLYLTAIPLAIGAWLLLPETDSDDSEAISIYLQRLLDLIKTRAIGLYLAAFTFRFILLFGFITYISVLATTHFQLAVAIVGVIVSVKGVASLLGATQGGRLVAASNPSYVVIIGFVLSGVGLGAMGMVESRLGIFITTFVFGLGDGIISPAQKSSINHVVPAHLRGGSLSMAVAFQNLGKIVGPSLFGLLLLAFSAAEVFILFGGVFGLLGIVTVWLAYLFSR